MSSGSGANRDRWFTTLRWGLLVLAIGDLAALRAGLTTHSHSILAWLMAAVVLSFGARLVQLVVLRFLDPHTPFQQYARMAIAAGIFVAVGAGLANWMLGLQGYVILTEQDKARLQRGEELQGFDPGPLVNIDELEVVVGLDELELVATGSDTFLPESRLKVWRGHKPPLSLQISPKERGAAGPLRFYQGAFGFAPRIVILKEGETQESLFDKVVPFLTERHGPDGIRFNGSFVVAEADLRVEGVIGLDSLDEAMRGHATLDLTVTHGKDLLGTGSLLPGHFAELDEGYRIGFAGLKMWSEIVISRRSYGTVMLAGAVLAVSGTFLLLFARGRDR